MRTFKLNDPHAPAAWRGVHVEGDYLYYDEFPEEFSPVQIRQVHLQPLYEVDAFRDEVATAINALQYAMQFTRALTDDPILTDALVKLELLNSKLVQAFDLARPPTDKSSVQQPQSDV